MIVLHIGTHKTGSKSLQRLLADYREELHALGYAVYQGMHHNPCNHAELGLAALRHDRDSFARWNHPGSSTPEFTRAVRARVAGFLAGLDTPHAILSNEDLAYLRHADEVETLRGILGGAGPVRVVVYLREKSAFLRSYAQQIRRRPGRLPSTDPRSAFYVEPDSWLVDYEGLVACYAAAFGRDGVTVLDYDDLLAREGNVIPSFLRTLGVPPFPGLDLRDYFLHRSSAATDPEHGPAT